MLTSNKNPNSILKIAATVYVGCSICLPYKEKIVKKDHIMLTPYIFIRKKRPHHADTIQKFKFHIKNSSSYSNICSSAPTQTSLKWFTEMKKKPHRHYKMMKMVHHSQILSPNQCGSTVVQSIRAPLPLVWSLIRDFRVPQGYKQFIKRCFLSSGDGCAGSVRELTLVSGLPAHRSTERLDRLDDDLHVMVVTIIGGDHKLVNYQSTVSLHEGDGGETVVVESYVVDVPADSSGEDTCLFADTIIKCNLKSLAKITEKMRVVG